MERDYLRKNGKRIFFLPILLLIVLNLNFSIEQESSFLEIQLKDLLVTKNIEESIFHSVSKECQRALIHMLNYFLSSDQIKTLLLDSGKGINDLGSYDSCNSEINSTYILLEVHDLPIRISLGICGPNECKLDDYNSLKPLLLEYMEETLFNNSVLQATALGNFEISEDSFEFLNPKELQEEYGQKKGGYGATVWYFVFIAALVLFCTGYDIYWMRQKKRYKQYKEYEDEKQKARDKWINYSITSEEFSVNRTRSEMSEDEAALINAKKGNAPKPVPRPLKNLMYQLCTCGSLIRTHQTLFHSKNKIDPNTDVLNGVRVISILWIIFGHTYSSNLGGSISNVFEVPNLVKEFSFSLVAMAEYGVDVFFYLTAFLAGAILYKKSQTKSFNILKVYLHRYIRLCPIYVITILFYTNILPVIYSGPLYNHVYNNAQKCKDYWFYNFLYVNNFKHWIVGYNRGDPDCMGWTWYLPNDFQFFLLAPLLILLYHKSRKLGLGLILLLFLVSVGIQAYLGQEYNLSVNIMRYNNAYFDLYYYVPYTRINPFFVGIVTGLAYSGYRDPSLSTKDCWKTLARRIKKSYYIRYSMYIIGFLICFWLVFLYYWMANYPSYWHQWLDTTYLIVSRPLFVFGITLMIFPVLIGKGRIILWTLGNPFFNVLAKVTYAAYMIHILIIDTISETEKKSRYLRNSEMYILFFGFAATTYLASLVVTLIYEAPFVNLEKQFLFVKRKVSQESTKQGSNSKSDKNKDSEIVGVQKPLDEEEIESLASQSKTIL